MLWPNGLWGGVVSGVGVNLSQYQSGKLTRSITRKRLGILENEVIVISVGDLVKRKNYETSIRALALAQCLNLHYFICGDGPLRNQLEKMSRDLGVDNQIHFLGRRSDIKELLSAADIFLFSTFQEGLSRSLMEAMAMGLPCIVPNIRGNTDLIDNGQGGFLFNPKDVKGFADSILSMTKDVRLRQEMSQKYQQD